MAYIINNVSEFVINMNMINAGLKGNELIIFAYIDFVCNHSINESYDEGIAALTRKLKLTQPTVINTIKKLVGYGLIKKSYYLDENRNKRCILKTCYQKNEQ